MLCIAAEAHTAMTEAQRAHAQSDARQLSAHRVVSSVPYREYIAD
jgi:hypothetical protein